MWFGGRILEHLLMKNWPPGLSLPAPSGGLGHSPPSGPSAVTAAALSRGAAQLLKLGLLWGTMLGSVRAV